MRLLAGIETLSPQAGRSETPNGYPVSGDDERPPVFSATMAAVLSKAEPLVVRSLIGGHASPTPPAIQGTTAGGVRSEGQESATSKEPLSVASAPVRQAPVAGAPPVAAPPAAVELPVGSATAVTPEESVEPPQPTPGVSHAVSQATGSMLDVHGGVLSPTKSPSKDLVEAEGKGSSKPTKKKPAGDGSQTATPSSSAAQPAQGLQQANPTPLPAQPVILRGAEVSSPAAGGGIRESAAKTAPDALRAQNMHSPSGAVAETVSSDALPHAPEVKANMPARGHVAGKGDAEERGGVSAAVAPALRDHSAIHGLKESDPGTMIRPSEAVREAEHASAAPAQNLELVRSHPAQALTTGAVQHIGATQVLDRMDAASSASSIALHGDARHLSVGIASGTLGWLEIHATAAAGGRINAALHAQGEGSAQLLSSQTTAIVDYARQHQIPMGQLSVSVGIGSGRTGTEDSRGSSQNPSSSAVSETERPAAPSPGGEEYTIEQSVSLINIRA